PAKRTRNSPEKTPADPGTACTKVVVPKITRFSFRCGSGCITKRGGLTHSPLQGLGRSGLPTNARSVPNRDASSRMFTVLRSTARAGFKRQNPMFQHALLVPAWSFALITGVWCLGLVL